MIPPSENGPGSGDEGAPRPADPARLGRSGSRGPELDRLPPPVFPPGSRRIAARYQGTPTTDGEEAEGEGSVPDDAFISPDDPIRRTPEWDEALISPDEPIVRTAPPRPPADESEEIEVTGIGGAERIVPHEVLTADAAETERLADRLETLSRDLRERGAAALRVAADTDGVDAVLRAFLSGYLEGRKR